MEFFFGQSTDLTCCKNIVGVFGADSMRKDVVEEVFDDCAILADLLVGLSNMSGRSVRAVESQPKISY